MVIFILTNRDMQLYRWVMKSYLNSDDHMRFKLATTTHILYLIGCLRGIVYVGKLPHLYRPVSLSTRVIFGLMTNTVPLHSTSNIKIMHECVWCVYFTQWHVFPAASGQGQRASPGNA